MSDVAQDLASVSQFMSHNSIHTEQSRQYGVKTHKHWYFKLYSKIILLKPAPV